MIRGLRVPPLTLVMLALVAGVPAHSTSLPGTFSIVAFDSVTQELGVAVESKYFSVGRVVPWAEAGVGAVATQAGVNPTYGPKGLAMLRNGMTPAEVLAAFAASDSSWATRQLGIVDAHGHA